MRELPDRRRGRERGRGRIKFRIPARSLPPPPFLYDQGQPPPHPPPPQPLPTPPPPPPVFYSHHLTRTPGEKFNLCIFHCGCPTLAQRLMKVSSSPSAPPNPYLPTSTPPPPTSLSHPRHICMCVWGEAPLVRNDDDEKKKKRARQPAEISFFFFLARLGCAAVAAAVLRAESEKTGHMAPPSYQRLVAQSEGCSRSDSGLLRSFFFFLPHKIKPPVGCSSSSGGGYTM